MMKLTKRKPDSLGTILKKEFMEPYGLTSAELAKAMGISKHAVDILLTDKDEITIDIAILLAKAFNNTPQFWLNISIDNQLWKALHDNRKRMRFKRAMSIFHFVDALHGA